MFTIESSLNIILKSLYLSYIYPDKKNYNDVIKKSSKYKFNDKFTGDILRSCIICHTDLLSETVNNTMHPKINEMLNYQDNRIIFDIILNILKNKIKRNYSVDKLKLLCERVVEQPMYFLTDTKCSYDYIIKIGSRYLVNLITDNIKKKNIDIFIISKLLNYVSNFGYKIKNPNMHSYSLNMLPNKKSSMNDYIYEQYLNIKYHVFSKENYDMHTLLNDNNEQIDQEKELMDYYYNLANRHKRSKRTFTTQNNNTIITNIYYLHDENEYFNSKYNEHQKKYNKMNKQKYNQDHIDIEHYNNMCKFDIIMSYI